MIANPDTDPGMVDYYQDLLDDENNILADLTTEATAAGIPQSDLDQIDAEAEANVANNPINQETWDGGDNTFLPGVGGAFVGAGQGVLNTINGVQDAAIGFMNLPASQVNGIASGLEAIGILDSNPESPLRVPYIPSPDWSRGVLSHEGGSGWADSHNWSKGLGGFGVLVIAPNIQPLTIIGGRTAIAQEFHVIYQPGTRGPWIHGTGIRIGRLRVTRMKANQVIEHVDSKIFTVKLPIVFTRAAAQTGARTHSCVAAAARAFLRGWIPFL